MFKPLPFMLLFSIIFTTFVGSASYAKQSASNKAPKKQTEQVITDYEKVLKGAKLIGKGSVTAFSKNGNTVILLPKEIIGKTLLWYSEAVKLPPTAVSDDGIALDSKIGSTAIKLELKDKFIIVRDYSPGLTKRSDVSDPVLANQNDLKIRPIQNSINKSTLGPIITVLPILATSPTGDYLVDFTKAFSKDIETMSARKHIVSSGLVPVSVDPGRSYISNVKVFKNNLDIRTHLTFLATDPKNTASGTQPVSIEIGHSIILLPKKPMKGRLFDERVGFLNTKYTEYETKEGEITSRRALILRRRLEKKNPDAKVSDPIRPITFYIGQDVPDRWRPYLKAAVEQWQPAFKAAGFSTAIIAKDAPTPEEDPNWSAEDARFNVIRWISQPQANAMGPVIYDPRSGEILSSHIMVWPDVIKMFERYYFGITSSLDPEAKTIPFSDKKRGEILQYVVAHEVGHTLGLRHNHLASTAYSVKDMRTPEFANKYGPNASIMAYGRFNQCAQPGDGVTQFIPIIGPYDFFAIDWAYGIHGKTDKEEQAALKRLADKSEVERPLTWAASETPEEIEKWNFDPRLQRENTGAERLEATRLVVANLLRSLNNLDKATAGDEKVFSWTYNYLGLLQEGFIRSVNSLIGGTINQPSTSKGLRVKIVPADQQRAAVKYLLEEAPKSFEPYKQPKILYRAKTIGAVRNIESKQAGIINDLLTGTHLALLESQKSEDDINYGVLDFANDIHKSLWSDLSTTPRWKQRLQEAYLNRVKNILHPDDNHEKERAASISALISKGINIDYVGIATASGANTIFPSWARSTLPQLKTKLEKAAAATSDPRVKLHFEAMGRQIEKIISP